MYQAARNKLKLWDLTEKQINDIEKEGEPQHYFEVESPISGIVTKRDVSVGDYVKEGETLLTVVDLSHVWVLFEAYESDLPWINMGDKVNFSIKSLPGKDFSGNIKFIDRLINPKTRTAKVRVELNNPGLQLKPEMFVDGVVISKFAENKKQLLVPKTAVLWTGKRSVVYVKHERKDNITFEYREIDLGPEAGNYYVVNSGIKEGEEVATNGVFKIDASAQLSGKPSMMNPSGGKVSTGHNHVNMNMDNTNKVNLKQEMFKVSGNCEMCQDRIETAALSLTGVKSAEWNIETKMLHISFDPSQIKVEDIHKKIASVGHDTKLVKAPDSVYNKLPECCLYRDKN